MTYYRTCPKCGAHLDPGEKCDCEDAQRPGDTKPLPQPCKVCKDHKAGKPFAIRADNAALYKTSHISHCPYCGRFLVENYQIKSPSSAGTD